MRFSSVSFYYFYLFGLTTCLWWFNTLSCFSVVSFSTFSVFISDEISFFMGLVTILVIVFSHMYSSIDSNSSNIIMFSLMLSSLMVFATNSFFLLYFFYEFSLVPIVLIIMVWGVYSERSLGSFLLLAYTVVFSLPFMGVLFYLWIVNGSFSIPLLDGITSSSLPLSEFITISIFLLFAVNLPIFGVHYWLPVAHVEAPTYGSIILAGILLKLGGVGLLRFSSFINMSFLTDSILSYLLVFLVYSSIICCYQQDFNRLIAYSSVFHIIAVPLLLVSSSSLSSSVILIIMCFHGISSPLLFSLVGITYSIFGSRQLIILRGLLSLSPILSLLFLFGFFANISAPPLPGFISEVLFFVSCYYLTPISVLFFLVTVLMGLIYNLNWFLLVSLNVNVNSNVQYFLSFRFFSPVVLIATTYVIFLTMISFF